VHKDPRHVAELDNRGLGHHRGSRGGPRRHVWLSSGSELRSALTKYPTTPLEHSHDVFKVGYNKKSRPFSSFRPYPLDPSLPSLTPSLCVFA
jgi:hypothetical protein